MYRRLRNYLAELTVGRIVLWFYLIWYMVVAVRYFDRSLTLWSTSLGLSVIIGTALVINANSSGAEGQRLDPWPTFRFFLTPFCVSSFAVLVKGKGFFLIFSPHLSEMVFAALVCAVLGLAAAIARRGRGVKN